MEKQLDPIEIRENLSRFCGTEHIYRECIGDFLYTDGVKYMAEACKAYWLLTDAGIQSKALMTKSEFIKITISCMDEKVTVDYTDGNGTMLHQHEYQFSDFPLNVLSLYFVNRTLLLPSEY